MIEFTDDPYNRKALEWAVWLQQAKNPYALLDAAFDKELLDFMMYMRVAWEMSDNIITIGKIETYPPIPEQLACEGLVPDYETTLYGGHWTSKLVGYKLGIVWKKDPQRREKETP